MFNVKAEKVEKAKTVTVIESILRDGEYHCKSDGSKNEWTVLKKGDNFFCDCPDSRKGICKHIVAVLQCEKIQFEIEDEKPKKEDAEKGGYVPCKYNYDRYEVISAFHKEMRRGDVEKAWWWLQIMIDSGYGAFYINNYINGLIGEELCVCDSKAVERIKLYLNYKVIDEYMLYAVVDIFCASKKHWECERCHLRRKMWLRNRLNVKDGKKKLYEIPHYAHDNHTRKGKTMRFEEIDWRWSGTRLGMEWRRRCIIQGLDPVKAKWEEVKWEEGEIEFFKSCG